MSGNRKSAGREVASRVNLEERVRNIEIENAERFATIMTQLQHLREGMDQLVRNQSDHITQHKETEVEVSNLKLRMSGAEKSIKSFHGKLWGAVIAVLGSIGTAVAAMFKWPS